MCSSMKPNFHHCHEVVKLHDSGVVGISQCAKVVRLILSKTVLSSCSVPACYRSEALRPRALPV